MSPLRSVFKVANLQVVSRKLTVDSRWGSAVCILDPKETEDTASGPGYEFNNNEPTSQEG